jgi:hypothetical protein
MKVVFSEAIGGSIDVDKTQWCCEEFKHASELYKEVTDENGAVIGNQPLYQFNYEKMRFEEITDGIMYGNGGFGDRFWGERLKVCPFCGTKIKIIRIFI